MNRILKDFLVIDIETVSKEATFDLLTDDIKKHWKKKIGKILNSEDSLENTYFEKAAIYAEFGKIVVIGMAFFLESGGKLGLRIKSLASHNEKELLATFKNFIESKFDQENLRLCAHNGKEFDFPYLCRRMLINDIKIPSALNISGKKPWEINHIDTMELWKFGDRKNFTSLDLLTSIFDIPSSKDDMDGSQVTSVYYNEEKGLARIEKYCQKDVIATSQLYLRLNNLPLIDENEITVVH